MTRAHRQRAHRVPKQFMCPRSNEFMKKPVIVPSTQWICDYKSLIFLRINNNNFPNEDEDELLRPDYDLRSQSSTWLHKYERRPPFTYISTPMGLERDIWEDLNLRDNLRQLSSAIPGKNLAHKFSKGLFILILTLILIHRSLFYILSHYNSCLHRQDLTRKHLWRGTTWNEKSRRIIITKPLYNIINHVRGNGFYKF